MKEKKVKREMKRKEKEKEREKNERKKAFFLSFCGEEIRKLNPIECERVQR